MAEDEASDSADKNIRILAAGYALASTFGAEEELRKGNWVIGAVCVGFSVMFQFLWYFWNWLKSRIDQRLVVTASTLAMDTRWWIGSVLAFFIFLGLTPLVKKISASANRANEASPPVAYYSAHDKEQIADALSEIGNIANKTINGTTQYRDLLLTSTEGFPSRPRELIVAANIVITLYEETFSYAKFTGRMGVYKQYSKFLTPLLYNDSYVNMFMATKDYCEKELSSLAKSVPIVAKLQDNSDTTGSQEIMDLYHFAYMNNTVDCLDKLRAFSEEVISATDNARASLASP